MAERPPLGAQAAQAQKNQGVTTVDCEQVNPWGESSPDDHRSEGQGRPGTETNTPPAAERNLLTAQGRPGQKQTHLQLQRGTF
ncbi:hypothetical protein F7725_025839 [Dissostichus mawsoni]|uniref:Uncharacterized protein n=1 Tax=Dissostichus mawsoni TaxID=36200 RepID=A0A7J5X5D2_DISMA|nr:hypothetical protein F7725_025839 [Dissostichus mawsoni]